MKITKYLFLPILLFINTCISLGQIKLCEEQNSYHPVDYKIFELRDSLLSESVDTIIVYSHWVVTNGFNGYGKVAWKKDGETYLVKFDYDKYDKRIKEEQIKISNDTMFSFFFENKLDSIKTNPEQELRVSHDGRHFINIYWGGNEHCFTIRNVLVQFNSENKRVQWVNYFKEKGTDWYFVDPIPTGTNNEYPKTRKNRRRE